MNHGFGAAAERQPPEEQRVQPGAKARSTDDHSCRIGVLAPSLNSPSQSVVRRRYRRAASGANTAISATDQISDANTGCCIGQV